MPGEHPGFGVGVKSSVIFLGSLAGYEATSRIDDFVFVTLTAFPSSNEFIRPRYD